MGLYDRDYTQADSRRQYYGAPRMRISWPPLTPVVRTLLLVNVAVFVLQFLAGSSRLNYLIDDWLAVYPASLLQALEVWRLITYQFLHADLTHIFMNMLALYFLGPILEQHWGGRRFLTFYLGCGAVGGLLYPILLALGILHAPAAHLVGASGAILGLLAACAILFPHFVLFIYFFPVPIRVAALLLIVMAVAAILSRGPNAGGEAAHLGGMAAGGLYVLTESWRAKWLWPIRSRLRRRDLQHQQSLQAEIDRILDKVRNSGLHSLTAKEKRVLRKATLLEQQRRGL